MQQKRLYFLLALLTALALLAGCAVPAAPAAAPAGEAPAEEAAAEEAAPAAEGVTELRITWYDDGNEGAVLRELLDRFEAENPDIKVVIDTVPYDPGIQKTLPLQLEAGEGPDMARITQLGVMSQYLFDLRPYLSDAAYWEENFGPFLEWMQQTPDGTVIPGFMTQLTVTGPFINRTLFDQAGVAVPSDSSDQVTWEEWAAASKQVADAIGNGVYAMAMDRSGHRLASLAVSMGATYFDAEGHPALLEDAGFKTTGELMMQWHEDGTMLPEVWIGNAGNYVAGADPFVNGQIVMYASGSWQIGSFVSKIGDAFDWEAVPNPCGPAACTGLPGGAALVALNTTQHPEEVARVMEYLTQADVMAEFYARTLFIPGHLGLAASGVDFQTDLPQAKKSLDVFAAEVGKLAQLAYDLQAYKYNTILFNANRDRLSQALAGEMTLDEAIQRMQEDIDTGIAAAEAGTQ